MSASQLKYLTTGALAKQLGISVRTIRYYDQIGLVRPSMKGAGGRRHYGPDDILQLQKILLLKSLNLSLEDSRSILSERSMEEILAVHRSILLDEIKCLEASLKHTNSLLNMLNLENGTIDWSDLLELVVASKEEKEWQQFFSPEQQEQLQERLPKIEHGDLATKKWINLTRRIQLCLEKGTGPSSEEARLILEDLELLTEETFGHAPELISAFWEVRRSPSASAEVGLYPLDPSIIEYIEAIDEHRSIVIPSKDRRQ